MYTKIVTLLEWIGSSNSTRKTDSHLKRIISILSDDCLLSWLDWKFQSKQVNRESSKKYNKYSFRRLSVVLVGLEVPIQTGQQTII